MNRHGFLCLLLLLVCAGSLYAEIAFYTVTSWSSLSAFTVVRGTPAIYGGYLGNSESDPYTETKLNYSGAIPSYDYSVQTDLIADSPDWGWDYPVFLHYLRSSASSHYQVRVVRTGSWFDIYVGRSTSPGVVTNLAYTGVESGCWPCTLRSSIQGNTITVSLNGSLLLSVSDSTLTTGTVGIGSAYTRYAFATTVFLGTDTTPPDTPAVSASAYGTRVNLSWTEAHDNVGVAMYKVFRHDPQHPENGDVLLAPLNSSARSYTDNSALPPLHTYTYKVQAIDGSWNASAFGTTDVTIPGPVDWAPETGGPVEYAATWGAEPEKIGVLNGVLSIRLPLIKATHRSSGSGFQFAAVWNSGFWGKEGTNPSKMSAVDTGYGLGFNFIIGAAYAVYSSNEIDHIRFFSADGILHRLLPTDSSKRYFRSQDSTYLLWDNEASPYPTLTFKDGTVWTFGCVSRNIDDGGTRYPTELRDTNGNLISIQYGSMAGGQDGPNANTSGRIIFVSDSQTIYIWNWQPAPFPWWAPIGEHLHLASVNHSDGQQNYTDANFTYSTPTNLASPFSDGQTITGATLLTAITFTGLTAPYYFQYSTSGEITKITLPYKGYFRYDYVTASFSSPSRQTREIAVRYTSADGTNEQAYTFSHPAGDTSLSQHSQSTLLDPAGNKKIWDFIHGSSRGWDNGLNSKAETYQGLATDPLRKVETTWTQDDENSTALKNPRVYSITTTERDALGNAVSSKVEQDVDANGNVTQVREYGYADTTPFRTTSTSYLATSPYTSRNILNRPSQVTVCAGAVGCGTPASQTTITYDSTALTDVPSILRHASDYGTSFAYRGNPTVTNANGLVTNINYDIGGNVVSTSGAVNQTVSYVPSNATQVSQAQGGGNTTSYSYYGDLSLASVTGSNSDTTAFNYSQRRPTSTTLPGGGQVTYTYADGNNGWWGAPWSYPFWRQETTPMGRVSKTFYDGFGRVIKTAVRESTSPEAWIYTETQYNACSCNPMGRAVKQSRPYRGDASGTPSETVYWTETTFDALGRSVQVTLPDGNHTTYAYSIVNDSNWKGSLTTITDPLGKQKRYLYDASGNLVRVEEERDQPGTLVETARYTYDVMGQLGTVQMGRRTDGTFKQTRSFVYNTKGQLVSATNPENGTVTYTYTSDGLLETKTDAKLAAANQKLWYVYDGYKRLTGIEHEVAGQHTAKATFGYDSDPSFGTASALGRMTWAKNDGYTWHFAYDAAGRVSTQTLELPYTQSGYPLRVQAAYTYDADGRLTSLAYPGTMYDCSSGCTGGVYNYSYDLLGRALSASGPSGTLAQNATYNAAGQVTAWQEVVYPSLTYSATRQYDALRGWLRAVDVKDPNNQDVVSLTYRYFGDGRVSGAYDSVNPALSALYQHDSLNRLNSTTAGSIADPNAAQWQIGTTNWALQWSYDEFGNRLSQTKVPGSNGSPPEITLSYDEATNRITTGQYTYDLNGNITAAPAVGNAPAISGIQWDVLDRIAQVTVNGTTKYYKYDAFGRRMESRTGQNGVPRIYFYDGKGRVLAEYDTYYWGATPARKYVYFAGQQLGQYKDRVGSVRNTNGGTSSHYYPFGEEITSTANDRYKFAETYRDSDTGLDYALNRYYASGIGRFLSPDPYKASGGPADPQSWNRYAYVQNDPVNSYDPLGLLIAEPGVWPCGDDWIWDPSLSGPCYGGLWYFFTFPIAIGGGGGGGGGSPPPKPKHDCLDDLPAFEVGFVTSHYADSVELGTQAGIPQDWVLGWSAEESYWGTEGVVTGSNNYFGWHGRGDVPCPPGANKITGCFSSFYASGETALFSKQNWFRYKGKVHVPSADILSDQYKNRASATQAFQTLSNAGYNSDSSYGSKVANDVAEVDRVERCLRSKGMLK
jgi:RHS repeat-associated protein